MKKTILVLVVTSFLLQSCFSYKTIDQNSNSIVMGSVYKIKVGARTHKGTLVAVNDTTATLKIGTKQMNFKRDDIILIKKRKFSIAETVLLPVGIVVGIVGLFALTYSPDIKVGTAPN